MNGIRAVLKRLHSPDVADFEAFAPRDPRCFSVLVQAMFGPEGTAGEESFDVVVCTPKWLEREAEIKGIAYPRHHLVVNDFDIERLRAFLDGYARQCKSFRKRFCASQASPASGGFFTLQSLSG